MHLSEIRVVSEKCISVIQYNSGHNNLLGQICLMQIHFYAIYGHVAAIHLPPTLMSMIDVYKYICNVVTL